MNQNLLPKLFLFFPVLLCLFPVSTADAREMVTLEADTSQAEAGVIRFSWDYQGLDGFPLILEKSEDYPEGRVLTPNPGSPYIIQKPPGSYTFQLIIADRESSKGSLSILATSYPIEVTVPSVTLQWIDVPEWELTGELTLHWSALPGVARYEIEEIYRPVNEVKNSAKESNAVLEGSVPPSLSPARGREPAYRLPAGQAGPGRDLGEGDSDSGQLYSEVRILFEEKSFIRLVKDKGGWYRYRVRPIYDGEAQAAPTGSWSVPAEIRVLSDDEFLEFLAKRAFDYFWYEANPETGLVQERARRGGDEMEMPVRIGTCGLALSVFTVAAERKWIDPAIAREKVSLMLKTLRDEVDHERGWFYQYVDAYGKRVKEPKASGVSPLDVAVLLTGALQAGEYFGGEVRWIADQMHTRVEWSFLFDPSKNLFRESWSPEEGLAPRYLEEASQNLLLYLLAASSVRDPISPGSFYNLSRRKGSYEGGPEIIHTSDGSLFSYFFPNLWFDFRETVDFSGTNWWYNAMDAAIANRRFCLNHPRSGYSESVWGLTASEGPDGSQTYGALPAVRCVHDGTISPAAIAGSLPFIPDLALPALKDLFRKYGSKIWGEYGFVESFQPRSGWVSSFYNGLNAGILILSIENLRSGLVWKTFMKNPYARKALAKTRFEGFAEPVGEVSLETPGELKDYQLGSYETLVGWMAEDESFAIEEESRMAPSDFALELLFKKEGTPYAMFFANQRSVSTEAPLDERDQVTMKVEGATDIEIKMWKKGAQELVSKFKKLPPLTSLGASPQVPVITPPSVTVAPSTPIRSPDQKATSSTPGYMPSILPIPVDFESLSFSSRDDGEISQTKAAAGGARKTLVLETFEYPEGWRESKSLFWWAPQGRTFYNWSNTSEIFHEGDHALRVHYRKLGLPYAAFVGSFHPADSRKDFRQFDELRVWVYGRIELTVQLRNETLETVTLGTQSTQSGTSWEMLRFDLRQFKLNPSQIQEILLIADPGQRFTEGLIYIDEVQLVSY